MEAKDRITADGITLADFFKRHHSQLPLKPRSDKTYTWPLKIERSHLLSRMFTRCGECYMIDSCIFYKAGAQACTARNRVIRGKVR